MPLRSGSSIELRQPRIAEIPARIPAPFRLENNVCFLQDPEQESDEATFLDECRLPGHIGPDGVLT
ncbi:MAG TPA: hypothetical protein VNQ79_25250 [Blastocatellia bacterium]|nr:hypothetical protein [Blastocatellia bacterium]